MNNTNQIIPPDQEFLSLNHEYLRPELRPIKTNTFYSRNERTIEDQLLREKVLKGKVTHTVGEAKLLLAEKKAREVETLQKQELLRSVERWNAVVEKERYNKQQRKKLKRIEKLRSEIP